ncbi:hypothetical protein BOTBODRAFT_44860 [Botryobasidium botryosum FD-172 SS1]|uniref:PH domain-containing protein n=1 Tax=Botryobasidium botryosum (strain FD-172 SS1) TaxID=930990 RepID=A0A067MPX8_BOTB1|nr:hypothetical protein BOTBODRAFT_44860 [Botryobasidium botryosum FD-172 SS1]
MPAIPNANNAQAALGVASLRASKIPTARRVSIERRRRERERRSSVENGQSGASPRSSPKASPKGYPKKRPSRGLQGLARAAYVSKSPFRSASDSSENAHDDGDNILVDNEPTEPTKPAVTPLTPPTPPPPTRVAALSSPANSTSPSPSRSNLVSKRLRGPRSQSSSPTASAKRSRRKTVTFNERCAVLEFDTDEFIMDGNVFEDDDDDEPHSSPTSAGGGTTEGKDDNHFDFHTETDSDVEMNISIRSIDGPITLDLDTPQDANTSFHSEAASFDDKFVTEIAADDTEPALPSTPPPSSSRLPFDTETEGGVPLGRSHHAERFREAHSLSASPAFDSPRAPQTQAEIEEVVGYLPESPTPARRSPLRDVYEGDSSSIQLPTPTRQPGLSEVAEYDNGQADPFMSYLPPDLLTPPPSASIADALDALTSVTSSPDLAQDFSPELKTAFFNASLPTTDSSGSISSLRSNTGSLTGRSPRIDRDEIRKRLLRRSATDDLLSTIADEDDLQPERVSTPLPRSGIPRPVSQLHRPSIFSDRPPLEYRLSQPTPGADGSHRGGTPTLLASHVDITHPTGDIFDVSSALDRLIQGEVTRESCEPQPPTSPAGSTIPLSGGSSMTETEDDDGPQTPTSLSSMSTPDLKMARVEKAEQMELAAAQASIAPRPASHLPARLDAATYPPTRIPSLSGKEAIRAHEERIIAKRRELRRKQTAGEGNATRPSRRRSRSTGDAEGEGASSRRKLDFDLLSAPIERAEGDIPLSDSIERELNKLYPSNQKYHLREHEGTIYATTEKVSHVSKAGDIDAGKAWRSVRRPSDMNEHSRQIKAYRAQAKPGKTHGKVFVKVVGLRKVAVPIPKQPTLFTCTLNNGIHCVTTPDCRLSPTSQINQEFELIEHPNLEFSLTLKIRKDSHILSQLRALAPSPIPSPPPQKGGMFGFFSPRKNRAPKHVLAPAPEVVEDSLARYLRPDGTFARAFVSFKDIARNCDTRLCEKSYELVGQWSDEGRRGTGSSSSVNATRPIGEIVLHVFRLPPLPGVPADQLPQSMDECQRGLRHIEWHKRMYHEGTLTQHGGDCSSWRRRHLRVVGGSIIAFNDITLKATATIELKKAIGVVDNDEPTSPMMGVEATTSAAANSRRSHDDEVYRVERSFRLLFPDDEEISFFADTDEDKAQWLKVLRTLIGRIPPYPLWAELIWQRQQDMTDFSRPVVPPKPW